MSIDLKNQKCQACSGNTPTFDEKQIIEHLAKLNRRNDAGQSVTSTYEQGSSTFRRLISVEREKGVRPLLNKIQKF